MNKVIITLNAGSSSIKFSVFQIDGGRPGSATKGQVEGIKDYDVAFDEIWNKLEGYTSGKHIAAIGHRVVHGGEKYTKPVLITDKVMADLTKLIPLAPLHQPHNLKAIRVFSRNHPEIPQIACFDTAFHRDRESVSERFGLPNELYKKGIKRYGFHGISYEYIINHLEKIDYDLSNSKVVVAHLGSGCSMCGIKQGRSVEATMNFSSLGGLPMGTRSGTLDPGVLIHLLKSEGMTVDELEELLYKKSGLLGISGVSSDMRTLKQSDKIGAKEAIDYFVYRVNYYLGALASSLHGIDALVFTAGVGENDSELRQRVCKMAKWMGIEIDDSANDRGDTRISTSDSRVSVWVIPANEEKMIAIHTIKLLEKEGS